MPNNQYVNKVEYNGQTLIDLTNDAVTPSDVLTGVTFHDRSGSLQQGGLITHNVYDGLDSTSKNDALSANKGKELYESINNIDGYTTLINDQAISNAYVTYNTYNTRKIDDYQVLVVLVDIGSWITASMVVIKNLFIIGKNVAIYYHDGASIIEVDLKYKSNTSIEAKYIGSPSTRVGIRIYGFMPVLL